MRLGLPLDVWQLEREDFAIYALKGKRDAMEDRFNVVTDPSKGISIYGIFDGHGGAKTAERWNMGKRIRDVEEGPDGSLWMLEDAAEGALIHVTPK